MKRSFVLFPYFLVCLFGSVLRAEEPKKPAVAFDDGPGRLDIRIGGEPFARYVYEDDQILRPYFCDVHSPGGVQVTRNHPPVEGENPDDHATMHPGFWLAFGDLNGADFWRNEARVEHEGFVKRVQGGNGTGSFTVKNSYRAEGEVICLEECQITVEVRPEGYWVYWDSTFSSPRGDFYFGDQEEMGLGVRVAGPMAVVRGGEMRDSRGRKNGAEIWGKQADWCCYSGTVGDRRVGVALMPHPDNFRRSWFHARDYGLLLANPFGRNAFTRGAESQVTVGKGERFRLRFGVLVYDGRPELDEAYEHYTRSVAKRAKTD